jgi:GntR family transcriptional regulator
MSSARYDDSRGLSGGPVSLAGAGAVQRDSPLPYYVQVKRLLLHEIESADLQPGDLLPSEQELCQRFDVSRTVIRQALGELVNEGRLYRMRGKGTFIAKPKLQEQFIESTVGFFEDLTSRGHRVDSRVMSCEVVAASDRVANALEIETGAKCIELVRLRLVNGEVIAFTKSYLPHFDAEFFEKLTSADLGPVSLYRFLEEEWGLQIDSGHRSLEAVAASPMLARLLEIETGEPALSIESIGRDASGRVVEYFQAWHRGDRTRLEMDVVRGQSHTALSASLS